MTIPTINSVEPKAVRAAVSKHGAALINLSGASQKEFIALSDELMTPMVHHATNTIERDPVASDPSTSTVNKGVEAIPLHREASYAPGCPDLLMFFCENPASNGGETVICDGSELLNQLDHSTREFVQDLDLYWSWEARPERWQRTLGVKTVEQANKTLDHVRRTLKPYEELKCHFEGDVLNGRFRTKAVVPSLFSGTPSFCNSLMIRAYRSKSDYYARDDYRVALADGSPFPADVLDKIRNVAEHVSDNIKWNPGEIVVVDNSRAMHGRRHFEDTRRRILIRMGHLKSAA